MKEVAVFFITWIICGLLATSGIEATSCQDLLDSKGYTSSYISRLYVKRSIRHERTFARSMSLFGPISFIIGLVYTGVYMDGFHYGCLAQVEAGLLEKATEE